MREQPGASIEMGSGPVSALKLGEQPYTRGMTGGSGGGGKEKSRGAGLGNSTLDRGTGGWDEGGLLVEYTGDGDHDGQDLVTKIERRQPG